MARAIFARKIRHTAQVVAPWCFADRIENNIVLCQIILEIGTRVIESAVGAQRTHELCIRSAGTAVTFAPKYFAICTAGVPEHVQREMRKDAARGRATLQKLLKVNAAMELPAGCTFGYGTLEVGEGLVTKCDELGESYQFYIVPGDDAVMSVLKACQGGCTGKFVLARPTNPEFSKDAHSLGPYGRYLRIWLRPVEIKPAQ